MQIQLSGDSLTAVSADWLIVPVFEQSNSPAEQLLDSTLGGTLTRLRERGDFSGKPGEIVELRDVPQLEADRLLVIGLGAAEHVTLAKFDQACMTFSRRISNKANLSLAISVPTLPQLSMAQVVQTLTTAAIVGSSGQALYKRELDRFPFQQVTLLGSGTGATDSIRKGEIIGNAINLTRELVNRHPGEMTPVAFAARAEQVASQLGLGCEIWDEQRLGQEKMGALLAVARGSQQPPRAIFLRYQGAGPDAPWLGLVGKGVTFDSGGLSLKPSDSMKTMKADMAGAATVLGAISAIAQLKLPVNVLGAVGLVENMLGGNSYMLGEVLTARNGTTIEVHNTDAEGRLVLADILAYVVEQKVTNLIDLATLTGSCVVALGEEVTGAFANHQPWCNQVLRSAADVAEDVWQMPMFDSFAEQLKCDIADVKNVGTRWGGAITAAKFLERFVDGTPWVHLDIAGPSFAESTKPYREGGGTGAMLRTLVHLAESYPSAD